jgi:xylulokinase
MIARAVPGRSNGSRRREHMMFLGIDIGTGSSKAVAVDERGAILASASRPHPTSSPHPGWFEHDADGVWWEDLRALVLEVANTVAMDRILAVGISGIGPCALLADSMGQALRPAILYGIDTRAGAEIDELTASLGADQVLERTGNQLTTQAVGPKLLWLAHHEPDVWHEARRWYCASNYLVGRLTGEYVIDNYSASTSDPLYDLTAKDWWPEAWSASATTLDQPRLAWPGAVVGSVQPSAARETGLAPGTPILAGTIDALAEAYSAGCRDVGDTMVMYGSTLFLIQTVARPLVHPGLWAAAGRSEDTFSIAAGMATSGLVTTWLAELTGAEIGRLVDEAAEVGAGSEGLVLLPYFAGERTPLFDPHARGCWLGLTLDHGRGHLYRSTLEGVSYGVRHNFEAMGEAGATPVRLVAVGGGTRGNLWTQILSDVTGMAQDLPTITIGASYGDARMAADACEVDTSDWNPVAARVDPDPTTSAVYEELYRIYRRTYPALRDDMHTLAAIGR